MKACEHYTRPDFLEETRRDREATAREEVLRFLEQCNFQTLYSIAPAGTNILQALLANRKGGDGQGVAALSAGTAVGPKEVKGLPPSHLASHTQEVQVCVGAPRRSRGRSFEPTLVALLSSPSRKNPERMMQASRDHKKLVSRSLAAPFVSLRV